MRQRRESERWGWVGEEAGGGEEERRGESRPTTGVPVAETAAEQL